MKRSVPLIILSLAMSATAAAEAEAPSDPVADSFARMLNHTPVKTAPPAQRGPQEVDPLMAGVNAVLWSAQPRSFHIAQHRPDDGPARRRD